METDQTNRRRFTGVVIPGILLVTSEILIFLPNIVKLDQYFTEKNWSLPLIGFFIFIFTTIWMINLLIKNRTDWIHNRGYIILNTLTTATAFRISLLTDIEGEGFLFALVSSALCLYLIQKNLSGLEMSTRTKLPNVEAAFSQRIREQEEQLNVTNQRLGEEKQKNSQLTFLIELSRQLSEEIDPPIAAQLTVNTLAKAIECSIISILLFEREKKEFVTLAAGGPSTTLLLPNQSHNANSGIYSRLFRQKNTIVVNEINSQGDISISRNEKTESIMIAPILSQGQLTGAIELRSDKPHIFTNTDLINVEGAAGQLSRAWERANYNQRLTDLIKSGISLAILLDPQMAVQEIASLAQKTFDAQFVFVTLLDQQGGFTRSAHVGNAPKLNHSLQSNSKNEPLIQGALNATKPFRVRDLRKYSDQNKIQLDRPDLRSVLATPIRLHGLSIGTILIFGKVDGVFFSKNDEALADLLSSQAAASVESSWLYNELRNTLSITSMLRQLSEKVLVAEDLKDASEAILQSASKTVNAIEAGIYLASPSGDFTIQLQLDEEGLHTDYDHPMDTINNSMKTGHGMFVSKGGGTLVCYPLMTLTKANGAIWMLIPESRGQNFANFQVIANQAAVSLERVRLLAESRRQAQEIEAAYRELELTYDQTLKALMSALDARDRETEGHSTRVSRLARTLGEKLGLDSSQLKSLERGALLHDIGKIGISDTILLKPGKLTDEEWNVMRLHPEIGARIIEDIPFLQESMSIVRNHHERWNGSGYPRGLIGENIPLDSRIFAVADVFDALTSERTYRQKSSPDEAVQYLHEQAGIQFDAQVVHELKKLPYVDFVTGNERE